MAGRNLWHQPQFQPELNSTYKFSGSRDRYSWERDYNHHLQRMQAVETRPVHHPKIKKREYHPRELLQLEAEKNINFINRTKINMLPLSSRNSSRPGSRRPSQYRSLPVSVNHSPLITPQASQLRRNTMPELYMNQSYPIIKRPTILKKSSKPHRKVVEEPSSLSYMDNLLQGLLVEIMENKKNCLRK